jgi:uncharacterized alpha/beta hydrolase family protein
MMTIILIIYLTILHCIQILTNSKANDDDDDYNKRILNRTLFQHILCHGWSESASAIDRTK